MSSDDEGSEESSEEEIQPKILPKRATRGVRVTDMHGEGDDEFYEQDFWAEGGEEDSDFSEGSSEEDIVDSDFDDTEEEEDETEVVVKEKSNKRKNVYVDKREQANKKQKVAINKAVAGKKVTKKGAVGMADAENLKELNSPVKKRSLRTSTQDKTKDTKEKRAKREKRKVKRERKEMRLWTQEEQLKEAEHTEILNKQSLEDLQRLEEKAKRVEVPLRARLTKPGVLYHSKGGVQTIAFTRQPAGVTYPDDVFSFSSPPVYPQKNLKCKISGLPAKYRDPATNMPFATLAAFKAIRASGSE